MTQILITFYFKNIDFTPTIFAGDAIIFCPKKKCSYKPYHLETMREDSLCCLQREEAFINTKSHIFEVNKGGVLFVCMFFSFLSFFLEGGGCSFFGGVAVVVFFFFFFLAHGLFIREENQVLKIKSRA